MAPRKSTTRGSLLVKSNSIASSSKITLNSLPPANVPNTITPEYVAKPRARIYMEEADREKMVQELVGFFPRKVCDDITKAARNEIDGTMGSLENWANSRVSPDDDDAQREVNIGLYASESLLESRIDKECDKLTAWLLRNPFDFKGDRNYVLPWHSGVDFPRGEYIASLPDGQAELDRRLAELRKKTEQARLVSQRLESAEKMIDRRLEIAKQRKAEVGFVKEILQSSGLSPLPRKAETIKRSLSALHDEIAPVDIPTPIPPQSLPPGSKAWEMGRQAYLNWAVGKLVPPPSTGEEAIEGVERDMKAGGGSEGVERLNSAS